MEEQSEEGSQDEQEEETCSCSFVVSGEMLVDQELYNCVTCSSSETGGLKCCCSGCADYCHAGHDVQFVAFGRGFCDCGAAGCELVNITRDVFPQYNKPPSCAPPAMRMGEEYCSSSRISCDCALLEEVKQQCCNLVAETKETFWLGCDESAGCLLENLAQAIFSHYTLGLDFDKQCSGVEFWVQVKRHLRDTEDGDSVSNAVAIDLHYDKDETAAETFGVGIFPSLSTVTYLSSPGAAPTLIVNNVIGSTVGDSLTSCVLSYPFPGKHIAFPGELLHGVPAHPSLLHLAPRDAILEQDDALRVTFLANIWLNHRPVGVKSLSISDSKNSPLKETFTVEPIAKKMRELVVRKEELNTYSKIHLPFVTSDSTWGKDDDDADLVLAMWIPNEAVKCDIIEDVDPSVVKLVYECEESYACLEYVGEETEDDI